MDSKSHNKFILFSREEKISKSNAVNVISKEIRTIMELEKNPKKFIGLAKNPNNLYISFAKNPGKYGNGRRFQNDPEENYLMTSSCLHHCEN